MSAKLALRDVEVPRSPGWTSHDGGRCPVMPEALVMIRYRNGDVVGPVVAQSRRWQRWRPDQLPASRTGETAFDIVAFKIEAGA